MAIIPKNLDPVQGLIDFTLNIKPYHTNIIEVLEEYLHTDFVHVNIKDEIEFCINLGFPNLNTIFSFEINEINLSNNSVIVPGSVSTSVNTGQHVQIEFSEFNNDHYYVDSIQYDPINNESEIFLINRLSSNIAGGKLVNSVIQYCPGSENKSTNVLDLPNMECDDGYGNIFDSFISNILSIDTNINQIVILDDHSIELSHTTTVQLINENLYSQGTDNDIVGTFHIESFLFNGNETVINVIEDISTFPTFNPSDSYKLLILYQNYDEVIDCNFDRDPSNSETVFVSIKEDFSIDIDVNYRDDFTVYNMENSFESKFDAIAQFEINSLVAPTIIESNTTPINPGLLDLWYDLSSDVLKQWNNHTWKSITYAYWFQEDLNNVQNSKRHKLVKNKFVDTGWVEVDPSLNDNLSLGYDQDPYSAAKNVYSHSVGQILPDISTNGLYLIGGNFIPYLLHNVTIEGYTNNGSIGRIDYKTYHILKYGTNTITLNQSLGDQTLIFKNGLSFIIEDSTLINKSFNVSSSIFDGTNTIITVFESITHNEFYNITNVGSIPGIFYIQSTPNNHGVSTLMVLNTPLDVNINFIDYTYIGPLQLTIDMFNIDDKIPVLSSDDFISNEFVGVEGISSSGDIMTTTILDEVLWSWGNIDEWFQYYILGFPSVSSISIAGNATIDIQQGQQFRIIGNTPNAGIYSVNSITFDGTNTNISISETVDITELGGYIEPLDIMPIRIILEDIIGVSMEESTDGGILSNSGNMVQSLDYKYFDVGGYDSIDPNNL